MTNKLNTIQFVNNIRDSGNSRRTQLPYRVGGLEPVNNFGIAQIDGDIQYNGSAIFPNAICAKEIRLKENLSTDLQLQDGSANYVGLKAADTLSANQVWTMPSVDGGAGDLISTDGSGTLSFTPALSSGSVSTALDFTIDEAVLRVDLPSGSRNAQQSSVLLDDLGNYSQVQSINLLADANENLWYGYLALDANTTGNNNIAIGSEALGSNTFGFKNIAIGKDSMKANILGDENTALGYNSLKSCTGDYNTAIGSNALDSCTGDENTAVGNNALGSITTNGTCTAVGAYALSANTRSEIAAFGWFALGNNITGLRNTACGFASLRFNVSGDDCTAVGYSSLTLNTGHHNTAVGSSALAANAGGTRNTAVGRQCLDRNEIGNDCTAIGYRSLFANTTGNNNIAVGSAALASNTTGTNNTAIGRIALGFNLADDNTAIGSAALSLNTTGTSNTAVGKESLNANITGDDCTAIGYKSLFVNTVSDNTAVGSSALAANTIGTNNTAVGGQTMATNISGDDNTAVGYKSLSNILTGNKNTAIGYEVGINYTTSESDNILIGDDVQGTVGESNVIRIGKNQTSCFVKGIHNVTPGGATETVIIDSTGQLGSGSISTTPDSTGVLMGGLLTVNVDTTKFDIEDGTGIIFNPSTQVKTSVSWSGLTAQSTAYAGILTYVSISSGGAVVYNTSKVTNAQTRSQIFLGVLVHVDGTNIDVTNDEQVVLLNYVNSIRDLSEALGFINISGNTMSSAATALTILKSSGMMFKFGANWVGDESNPHVVSLATIDTSGSGIFQYRFQDGTSSALTLTDMIPNIKDDGTAYPGTTYANDRYGATRVYSFTSNNLKLQAPQYEYKKAEDAIDGILTEGYVTEPSLLENGMLIGFIITKGDTTDLSDEKDAVFISAGKLGAISSGGGSGSGDASTNTSSSTLNRVAVFADTTGKLLKEDSSVVLNSGSITGVYDLTATEIINFDPCTTFRVQTTAAGPTACELIANGNATSELHIENQSGTTPDAISIYANLGGIELSAGANGIELNNTSTSTALGFFKSPVSQQTTGTAEAAFIENAGGAVANVDSTFGGYTLQQVVQALRNYGLLA